MLVLLPFFACQLLIHMVLSLNPKILDSVYFIKHIVQVEDNWSRNPLNKLGELNTTRLKKDVVATNVTNSC